MNPIKVSVIVPVYNVEDYLVTCLESLVGQTLQESEIVVVNDGSPDNSQAIIDDYAARYPEKIRAYIKENGGLSDARNFGVQKATGEYICFVDSDDFIRSDMLELLYNKAVEEQSDVVVCDFYKFNEKTVKPAKFITNPDKFNHSIEECPELVFQCKSYPCNKLMRRAWYVENDFSFPCGQWFEDSAVVYNMLYLANKISVVPENLYYYRNVRTDSITNRTTDERVYDIFKSCKSLMMFYTEHTTNPEVIDAAVRLCQNHIFVRLKSLRNKGSLPFRLAFYHRAVSFLNQYCPNWQNNPYLLACKKRGLYMKIRHKPLLMYGYLMFPKWMRRMGRNAWRFFRDRKKRKKGSGAGHYINKTRLRELQRIELDILKEIDRVCKKHDITYYLGEGSLLGAVRHQGFIPWDDDLDILMPRADYERFLQLVSGELSDGYALLNQSVQDDYYLSFSKIVSLNKHGFINKEGRHEKQYKGPFVDVFPLDYFHTDDPKTLERQYLKVRKIRDMLLLKAGCIKARTKRRKRYRIEAKFHSFEALHRMLKKAMTCCDDSAAYMCNFASSYHPSRQIVPKEVYGEPVYVKFEDGEFPIPHDAHALLTAVYGDYMKLPPIRSRKSKHGFYDQISVTTMYETELQEWEETEALARAEIRKLQMYGLEILKEVDRVCRKHDITYYLGEGTLLGAIRHQGFIPWDDDIDIVMPREDLNRFMRICDRELDPKYKLQFYHNVKNYWVQSPKVRMLTPTEFQQPKLLKFTSDVGPYIDIFPLDYAPESFTELEAQNQYIKDQRRLLFLKTGFGTPMNKREKVRKFFSRFVSVRTIHERINKRAVKYNNGKRNYLCNFGSYYAIKKEVFPTVTFGKPVYVKFEDSEFPVPSNYDYVLTCTYGDYMTPPPRDKQVSKHSFG